MAVLCVIWAMVWWRWITFVQGTRNIFSISKACLHYIHIYVFVATIGKVGSEDQWIFPTAPIPEEVKKQIVATVVMVAVDVLFTSHLYTFGGKVFRQVEGGPIGLRATCAIARLVMCLWDKYWLERLAVQGLQLALYARYMDDGRCVLHPVKPGWRWTQGGLYYSPLWQVEDMELSPVERTRRVLHESMKGVINCLEFTTETQEQFEDNCLPTLDLNLWVEKGWQVHWKLFEKPTAPNVTVKKASAMAENSKIQILANDLVRRLLNCHRGLHKSYKEAVVDQYSQKLLNSGFGRPQVVRIIVAGIKGYERKVARCLVEGRPLYRTARQSGASRARKKILGKSEWFRTQKKSKEEEAPEVYGSSGNKADYKGKRTGSYKPGKAVKVRTVLFVENTPGGELARRIREVLSKNEGTLGFRIKVVERAGTPLARQFPLTNLFGGIPCGRDDCTTCAQGGDNLPPCTRRNVVYENVCTTCHPEAAEGKEVKEENLRLPAIYVGETCRSLAERSKEHWADYKAGLDSSHIRKHHITHHGGLGQPQFHLRPVKYYKTALGRQVGEAVRIRRRGEEKLLNSKAEFNRCKITRLSLPQKEKEDHPTKTTPPALPNCPEEDDIEKEQNTGEDTGGLQTLLEDRDYKDRTSRTATEWQLSPTQQVKRKDTGPQQGRQKLAKLDLPGEGRVSYHEGSPAVAGTTEPAPEYLPRLQPSNLPQKGRQLSIQECFQKSRDPAKTTPNHQVVVFDDPSAHQELPGEGRDYKEGRLAVPEHQETATEFLRIERGKENVKLSTAPSIANSEKLAENSTILPEPPSTNCPAQELPDYNEGSTTPCQRPPASRILGELFGRIYLNQLKLCHYPEVEVSSEGVPPKLDDEQARQNITSSKVAAGYNTNSVRGTTTESRDVRKQAPRNITSSKVAAGQDTIPERDAETENCDVTDDNYCKKHDAKLIERKVRERKWRLGKNSTYRYVYETSKTWICPAKLGFTW